MNTVLDKKAEDLKMGEATMKELSEIEARTKKFSLADAIRMGSTVTTPAVGNFGNGESACAMTAAVIAARAAGYM